MARNEPRVMRAHWLAFDEETAEGLGPVTGCHCGFKSDMEVSCGWGDDVVAHIVTVAMFEEVIAHG